MNKIQFIKYISQKNDIKKSEALRMFNTIADSIISAVSDNDELFLKGFGRFHKIKMLSRMGINLRTKEKMMLDAYTQICFRSSGKFKKACNS